MKKTLCILLTGLLATVPAFAEPLAYNITVKAGAKQTFAGFGASQVSQEFGHSAPEPFRSQMADLLYRDLKAKVLRLWLASGQEMTLEAMKSAFYAGYVDSGVIELIQKRGVSTVLLAPARGPEAPKEPLADYAGKLAQFIFDVKKERGIVISVTGIANEPEGWSGEQLKETVKLLRLELNKRKLAQVKIIAPESPSANDVNERQLDALHGDKAAWDALSGIATHSYNMAARDAEANRTFGKDYWMTEASDDGGEVGESENHAATISARFLNDLNHRVTHWIFFKGYSYSPDVRTDNYTASRLMQYDAASQANVVHLKYYYLKALLSAFDVGAILRRSESDLEADMVYTYGQKPRVCTAAGMNPDGSWAIGVVNLTGVTPDADITKWYPATPLEVTLSIEELLDAGNTTFQVYRSSAGRHGVYAGQITVKSKKLTFSLAPRELITLRSMKNLPAAPP